MWIDNLTPNGTETHRLGGLLFPAHDVLCRRVYLPYPSEFVFGDCSGFATANKWECYFKPITNCSYDRHVKAKHAHTTGKPLEPQARDPRVRVFQTLGESVRRASGVDDDDARTKSSHLGVRTADVRSLAKAAPCASPPLPRPRANSTNAWPLAPHRMILLRIHRW
jgi:hypothetical protein